MILRWGQVLVVAAVAGAGAGFISDGVHLGDTLYLDPKTVGWGVFFLVLAWLGRKELQRSSSP